MFYFAFSLYVAVLQRLIYVMCFGTVFAVIKIEIFADLKLKTYPINVKIDLVII